MLASLFELLFKYRPIVFQQGDFRFGTTPALSLAVLLAAAGAVAAVASYLRVTTRGGRRDRAVLLALRLSLIALVLFCLARPVLVIRTAVPQQNFLGILLDDSQSMRIADDGSEPRSAFVSGQFGDPASPVLEALADRFVLRFFRFSSRAERVTSPADLSFNGTRTRVTDALLRARDELTGLPVAGLVIVTDGADTGQGIVDESLLALKADAIPIFSVGVGSEQLSRDIQVGRVSVPTVVLRGSSLVVDAIVEHTGYAGQEVALNVESHGQILGSETVRLPPDGEPATVRVRFTADDPGPQVLSFRVPPRPGELVVENNVREVLVDVTDRRERILYFEGEPRFEVKFTRRAVADDKNLRLVVLQRMAENKYARYDIDHPDELAAGFPKTREELFAYSGLVLGSIEASAFTGDQLRMIGEFVDRRGGGLLVLGGRRSFVEGGYVGTSLADVLPVILEGSPSGRAESLVVRISARPTRAGAAHAALQIASNETESAERWMGLPQVTTVNVIDRAKPGATVLLTGVAQTEGQERELIVLASQRYGRGKTLAFPIQDSWLWQLHASMPVEDLTHENLWRQLLRWLIDGVPSQVETRMPQGQGEVGEEAVVEASVADGTYLAVNDARVVATITSPAGRSVELPLQWTGDRDGEYRAAFTPDENGTYEIAVAATRGDKKLGTDSSFLRTAPNNQEYFEAAMHASLLRRLAEETGGGFYTASTVEALAEDVRYTGRGVTTVEERELWDMPVLLALLLGLVLGEWMYRRARGLA